MSMNKDVELQSKILTHKKAMFQLLETLLLTLCLRLLANNNQFLKILQCQLYKVCWKVITVQFLHMDKQEQEKPLQWKEYRMILNYKVLFQELFVIFLQQFKAQLTQKNI